MAHQIMVCSGEKQGMYRLDCRYMKSLSTLQMKLFPKICRQNLRSKRTNKTIGKQNWFASWFDTRYYHILYKDRDYKEAQLFMDNITNYKCSYKYRKSVHTQTN